jgi:hypothetical protein
VPGFPRVGISVCFFGGLLVLMQRLRAALERGGLPPLSHPVAGAESGGKQAVSEMNEGAAWWSAGVLAG